MSEKKFAARPRSTAAKLITVSLIFSIFSASVPAAPEVVVSGVEQGWQDARFAILSSGFRERVPKLFWAFFTSGGTNSRQTQIAQIRIFPGPLNIRQGQTKELSAVAYDANDEPLSGIAFEWAVMDVGRLRPARRLMDSRFNARVPGTFTIKARAGGREAEIAAVVIPFRNSVPANATVHSVSPRTGRTVVRTTTASAADDEPEAKQQEKETAGEPTSADLMPGEGWDSTNWQSIDDPGNTTGDPPGGPADDGAGSGNFQLSAPVISLPGRGIDLALNLNYNSRLWNKSGTQITYDIDHGYPAPGWQLGFGRIVSMAEGGCMMLDADGTRRGYTGSVTEWNGGMSFTGHTADGSFIDYGCTFNYGTNASGWAWAKLPNGTSISYETAHSGNTHAVPTRITDAQGNYITITYQDRPGENIETITDTLGRVITFHYDSLGRLIEVRAPRMEPDDPQHAGGKTRTVMRLHYRSLALNYSFPGLTVRHWNQAPWVIDAIYYPATNTGYWFGDADSYSSYGMIARVVEQRAMSWTAGPEQQGTIAPGPITKQADYNYPLTVANETGRTNGVSLSDAPTYETLTESWAAADIAEPAVTRYKIQQSASPRSTSVIQPNGTISRQYSYNYTSLPATHPDKYKDGLIYLDETFSPDPAGTFTFPDLGIAGNYKRVAQSNVEWQQGHYWSPRPTSMEAFDENGHKVKTVYEYGNGGWFNQITRSCDYDNGNNLLRCATATYENDPSYIGTFNAQYAFQGGRHIFNLVKSSGIENPDGTRASFTEYEYDNYQAQPFTNAPGVIQHDFSHNSFFTGTQDGPNCVRWGPYYECALPDRCRDCEEWEQVPVYNTATEKRGNVTKVTSYADAQNLTGAIVETRGYDITGNLVKSSSACCEQTTILYDDPNTLEIDTQYAYPVSQTRGSADPNSPHRITTTAIYDFTTGLLKRATDANNRTSINWYHPDTLRPIRSISSTGAFTTTAYDDAAMTITEEARDSTGALAGRSKKFLNGIGLVRRVESDAPNGVVDISETKYTKYAEEWKQSRPYRAGDTVYWSEKFYDSQRRLIKIVEPDGSETKAFYNEATLPDSVTAQPGNRIRVVDAWGRERWGRYDQQGRLTQVVEPNPDATANPTASVLSAGSLLTKYSFDTVGRLIQTEQGAQIRKFRYDDLGRLTRQKLAEQTATLNDAGQYIGAGQAGANWSEAFWFDNRSNVTLKVDPRGVKTNLSYQLSGGGDDPLNRMQSRWYDLSGPLDTSSPIHAAPGVIYSYVTSGDKTRVAQIRTDGILTEDFLYDGESRVSEYKQTVDYRPTPMTVNYLYDSLDRVKEVMYPAQYGPTGGVRKIVLHSYDTASRLTNLSFGGQQQAGDIVYNSSEQTTEIKIGATGANQVTENYTFDPQTGLLTNQQATRNGSALLNLSYQYNRGGSAGSLNGKTGHLTKIIDNLNQNKNREYEFDAVGRLTKAKGGAGGALWTQNYSYDRYGNRTNVTSSGVAADGSAIPRDGIPNLAYSNTSNRITTAGWEYDSAGNQTRALAEDGVTWMKFEYDAANRIRVVKKDDANQTVLQAFVYGSTNARLIDYDAVAGLNKFYASTGGTVLAEYTEFQSATLTWTKTFTYLGDTQLATVTPNGNSENVEFNHPDRLGTRVITNQQTGGSSEQAHLPFGTALNAESSLTNNNKRFTSYDRSPTTGLDYAVNRTYDSKQGRFTQVDPIGMQAASLVSPQTLNMYSYCGNDPVNYVDPSGLFFGKLFKWIWRVVRAIAAAVFAVLAVLAFSIGIPWAGVALLTTSASIVASLFKIKPLQKLIAIASVAISLVRLNLTVTPTPPIFGFMSTTGAPSGGINIRILSVFSSVGAIANAFSTSRGGSTGSNCPPDCQDVITLPEETVTIDIPWYDKGTWRRIGTFLEGFAESLTFGLPSTIDGWMGRDRGVDRDAPEYGWGAVTGTVTSFVIPGAGAAKVAKGAKLGAKLFSRSGGILNRNRYVRLGWNKYRGKDVFRLSIGNKRTKYNPHWNIWTGK